MKKHYEQMESGYYHCVFLYGNPIQRYWHRGRFKKILERINTKDKTILDLGCGAGTLLTLLKDDYKKAIGIDFDEKQIEFAKENFNNKRIQWLCGDITKDKINEKFDYVICSEVIEHIELYNANVLLKSIRNLLKDEGTLILTTPNYRSLWPLIEIFVNILGKVNYAEQHVNRLDIHKLPYELKRNGFKIKSLATFYIISPFLALISLNLAKKVQKIEILLFPKLGSVMVVEAVK